MQRARERMSMRLHTEKSLIERARFLARSLSYNDGVDAAVKHTLHELCMALESRQTDQQKVPEPGYFLPLSALNEPMQIGIISLVDQAKRARWTDAIVRKDGVEHRHEADWIKHLIPLLDVLQPSIPKP